MAQGRAEGRTEGVRQGCREKLLCALEIRLEAGKKANAFAANLSLADFFKQQYGEKPQTHVLQSEERVLRAYVSSGFISETDYDVNSGNCHASKSRRGLSSR